jgi:uncharacterized protein (TIGR03435 family)
MKQRARLLAWWNLVPGMALVACAQQPSFDVASLKPVQSTVVPFLINLGTARNGEVKLTNTTLSDCLRYAYKITTDAQIVGPDWIRNKEVRFDILAKAPPQTPPDQLLLMLQTLLTERFKLVLHREPRDLPYLALTPGKNGPPGKNGSKLLAAKDGSTGVGGPHIPGRIISDRMTMNVLVTLLSRFLRQTVLDQTDLAGPYDINLTWTPESFAARPDSPAASETAPGPTIYTAVQEQLGLKLESRKGQIEVIVIDHAEKVPIEN